MEFWSAIAGLLRRRSVLIAAALVAVACGATAYVSTPVRYVSSTTMVLTTTEFGGTESQDPTNPTDLTNPMLNFNDSLRTTSAILIEEIGTKEVARQLGVRGSTKLVVNDGRTNPNLLGTNGPFIFVVGTSTSREKTQTLVAEVQQRMKDNLRELQRGLRAPANTYVILVDVVPPSPPEPSHAQEFKLGVIALIFGFLLSVGIAYLRDQLAARPAKAAAATQAEEEEDAPHVIAPMPPTEQANPAPVPKPPPKNGKSTPATKPPTKNGQPVDPALPAKTAAKARSR